MGSLPRNITRILLSQCVDTDHSTHRPQENLTGAALTLNQETSRHVKTVLKKNPGDPLVIIDNVKFRAYSATIQSVTPCVTILLEADLAVSFQKSRVNTVACALLKGDHTELVCEKVCELGAHHLIFWQADRSIVILDDNKTKKRQDRLQKIALSATQQSANPTPPTVTLLKSTSQLTQALLTSPHSAQLTLFCSLTEGSRELREISPPPTSCNLIIGPEGDLDEEEESLFKRAGFCPLTLGPTILRSETAAIAAHASVNALWGFADWKHAQ